MARPCGRDPFVAAFAQERDAAIAIRMIASAVEAAVTCTVRPIFGERGDVQMVVLEATFDDPGLLPRLETIARGAHGVPLRPEPIDIAKAV